MRSSFYAVLFPVVSVIAFFTLTFGAVSSKPADTKHVWKSFGSDEEGNSYSYDPGTVQRTADKTIKVWVKAEYSEKKSGLEEAQLLWEIDCSKKKFRGITAYTKKKDGTSSTLDKPSEWSDVPAGSMMESLHELVCTQPSKK
ncbi:MAG: surface-adhesin E family protein [Nitrospirota bacterium]